MNWRTFYVIHRKRIPHRIRTVTDGLANRLFDLSERLKIRRALRSGPPFSPTHDAVIIDVTTACNRFCVDCNRSVGRDQAMVREHIGLDQVEKFIAESIDSGRRWSRIDIEGGEPSLHPGIIEILKRLVDYRNRVSPGTNIRLLTSGFGPKAERLIAGLSALGVDVHNSAKTASEQDEHCAFNRAPCDLPGFNQEDFSAGCHLPAVYGLGLTRYGYYPHPVCGGIDRVFGFDLGRKTLPKPGDGMREQYTQLCRLCGFYAHSRRMQDGCKHPGIEDADRGSQTESWREAYSAYHAKPPRLTRY